MSWNSYLQQMQLAEINLNAALHHLDIDSAKSIGLSLLDLTMEAGFADLPDYLQASGHALLERAKREAALILVWRERIEGEVARRVADALAWEERHNDKIDDAEGVTVH